MLWIVKPTHRPTYYNWFFVCLQVPFSLFSIKKEKVYNLHKKSGEFSLPGSKNPLRPCAPIYDLHETAGGSPLTALAAPNVHPSSKRGREVCNRAGKSSVPIIKCGSKRAHHAPSRLQCLLFVFVRFFLVKLFHDQVVDSFQLIGIFDSGQNRLTVFIH